MELLTIPVSRIGPAQLKDVEHSGDELHDSFFRTCTVLQGDPPTSDIGDTVPYRIAKLYGGSWKTWNRHFVVQVSGCPFSCWYCYVDNLKYNCAFPAEALVDSFIQFRGKVEDLNVFHFMGGCPGRYSHLWKEIRACLDRKGLSRVVFLSDVLLVENWLYDQSPWSNIPDRSIVSVCLKGTNFQNFQRNTRVNYFAVAIRELWNYFGNPQVYYSLIEWDAKDEEYILALLDEDRIDWLQVKEYEVVKQRSNLPKKLPE